jgi:hypothetical protein
VLIKSEVPVYLLPREELESFASSSRFDISGNRLGHMPAVKFTFRGILYSAICGWAFSKHSRACCSILCENMTVLLPVRYLTSTMLHVHKVSDADHRNTCHYSRAVSISAIHPSGVPNDQQKMLQLVKKPGWSLGRRGLLGQREPARRMVMPLNQHSSGSTTRTPLGPYGRHI